MGTSLAILGMLGFFVGLVLLVIGLISKKKMKGGLVLGISVVVFIIGFIMVPTNGTESSKDTKDNEKVETAAKPKEETPEEEAARENKKTEVKDSNNGDLDYNIEEEKISGSIWYVTLSTSLTEENDLRKLVELTSDLAKAKDEKIDSIFVNVNIKDSLAKSYAAKGKVAFSDIGLAQTGLNKINEYEFQYLVTKEHLTSKKDLKQSNESYSAESILKAFQSAGLPTTDSRDNSHNCIDLECTTLITTEDVSIYEWPSVEKAKEVRAKNFGDAQVGTIIIRINNKALDIQKYIDVMNNVVNN